MENVSRRKPGSPAVPEPWGEEKGFPRGLQLAISAPPPIPLPTALGYHTIAPHPTGPPSLLHRLIRTCNSR